MPVNPLDLNSQYMLSGCQRSPHQSTKVSPLALFDFFVLEKDSEENKAQALGINIMKGKKKRKTRKLMKRSIL